MPDSPRPPFGGGSEDEPPSTVKQIVSDPARLKQRMLLSFAIGEAPRAKRRNPLRRPNGSR